MLKTVSSITNAIGALNYKGTWNASTNSPALASGVGTKGDYYVVSVAGTTTLDGISNWGVGDWATFNGSVWQRVEGGADVNGVNVTATDAVTGARLIPTGATVPANGMYLPATNAVGISSNSTQRIRFDSAGKVGTGKIDTPTFQFDNVMPNATPSGTRIISRLTGDNWNGNQNNIQYASALVTSVSATTVGANRMLQIDLGNIAFSIDGVYADTATSYAPTSDTIVNIQTRSTGVTQTAKLRPFANNTYSIGDATMRWSEVFASNGTINTSDLAFKTEIADLDATEQIVASELKGLIKRFKYKDAVAKKGDDARIHVGVIAQDVASAFAKHGLDANKYGVYCENTIYIEQDGQRFDKNTDSEGNIIEGRTAVVERGIRYDQLFAFIIAAL
jgi:hypothetical protein